MNVYPSLQDFISDVELVFYNCRLYNGAESPVGQMGIRVHSEYSALLKNFNLLERFGDEKEAKKFVLDEFCFENNNNQNEAFVEGFSDSELPKDSIRQMNEKHENNIESNNHVNKTPIQGAPDC